MSGYIWVQFGDARQTEDYPASDAKVTDAGHLIVTKADGSVNGYSRDVWEYFEFTEEDK